MTGLMVFLKKALMKYLAVIFSRIQCLSRVIVWGLMVMLHKVVLPSSTLEVPNNQGMPSRVFYDRMIGIFQDLSENCLFLVDTHGNIEQTWESVISNWPSEERKIIQVLLKKMEADSRFVKIDDERYDSIPKNKSKVCRYCLGLAHSLQAHILSTDKDLDDISEYLIRPGIDIFEYWQSFFNEMRREALSICLQDGEWNRSKFENKFLIPIFKYASYVDIFDRMSGQSLRQGSGISTIISDDIRDNYRKNLEWIVKTFWEKSELKEVERSIELYCAINPCGLSEEHIQQACEVMCAFEKKMKGQGLPIKVHLKKETDDKKMPHDRYIKTDQIAFQIGRGIDLLNNEGKIRDVTITYCPGIRKIIKSIKDMDDLCP